MPIKPLFSSLFVLVFAFSALAQSLIPIPGAGGLYGYADASGKVQTQPRFKKAWLPDAAGLVWALDNGDKVCLVHTDGTVVPAGITHRSWDAPMPVAATNTTSQVTWAFDTVAGVFCLRNSDYSDYVLFKNGKASTRYFSFEKLKSTVPVYGNYVNENYVAGPFTFFYGLHRVVKGENKVNFINTGLKEVFPQDYVNGVILKNGYLALASPESRFALADANGKIRTGFQYRNIMGALRPDRFVVNHIPAQHHTRNVGLIDADGRVVIDTVYEEMTAITENWLLARKNNQYGVLDYTGNTLLPFEYGILEYTQGGFFIASKEFSGFNLITIEGKPVLEKTAFKIQFNQSFTPADPAWYEITPEYKSSLRTLLDARLQVLVSDTFTRIERYYGTLKVTRPSGIGLYDVNGKQLVPAVYREIERMRDTSGFLAMRSDSLFGFYAMDGREVLPCMYTRIVPEKGPDGVVLWANKHRDKNLYTPFTLNGERLPLPDQIAPTLRAVDFKNCFVPDMAKGQWQLTLPDGSIVYKPRDYPYNNINIGTPDGCLMLEKANGNYTILDAYLKPIIPKGFFLPEKRYRGPYVKMGLIPVFNSANQSGIIDTKGAWVQKPGPFEYHILRPNMYSEHKGQPQQMDFRGITVCILTPDGLKKVDVEFVDDKFRNGYLVVGKAFSDAPQELLMKSSHYGRILKYAFMDTLGNLITPFSMKEFPWEPRGDRFFTEVYEPDYSTKKVVFDYSGRVVFDFGKEPVSNYDPERHWVYVTDSLGRTGIRDTLGREILPMRYTDFNWYTTGVFFHGRLPDGSRQLCTADGTVLLTGFRYLQRIDALPDGYYFVVTDATAHVVSPDQKVLCSLPGKEKDDVYGFPELIRVKTEDGVVRYVRFRKGQVYGG